MNTPYILYNMSTTTYSNKLFIVYACESEHGLRSKSFVQRKDKKKTKFKMEFKGHFIQDSLAFTLNFE